MKYSVQLTKRINKVNISIHVKQKLVKENIYSTLSNKIIYQEIIKVSSTYEAVCTYYDEISKFVYLGYNITGSNNQGILITLASYKQRQTS